MITLDLDDTMPFGKYRGKSLENIARMNPGYLSWFRRTITNYKLSNRVWTLAVSVGIANCEYEADQYGTAGDWGFPEF